MLKVQLFTAVLGLGAILFCLGDANSDASSQGQPPPPDSMQNQEPAMPQGIDVQARGPVHEAFASPTSEPQAPPLINKQPPVPLEEMPPEDRPEGNVVWIGGYYHYDDERQDFIWISGCWRAKPPGREWVPGYWREDNNSWQWNAGFWAVSNQEGKVEEINYLPPLPQQPNVAPPGDPPAADAFYVPGYYSWAETRYVWRAGFWTHGQVGYVYVPPHYRWTLRGLVFIPGHWDLVMARRGLLYSPVYVNAAVVAPGYVYTPAYAVNSTYVVDVMFVRPAHCHYYFGDYYGPRYVGWGYESCLVYSRRCYDPHVCYMRWHQPAWYNIHVNVYNDRLAGRIALPPRRMVEIDVRLRSSYVGHSRVVIVAHGGRHVPVAHAERVAIRNHHVAVQRAVHESRMRHERPGAGHGAVPVHMPAHPQHGAPAKSNNNQNNNNNHPAPPGPHGKQPAAPPPGKQLPAKQPAPNMKQPPAPPAKKPPAQHGKQASAPQMRQSPPPLMKHSAPAKSKQPPKKS